MSYEARHAAGINYGLMAACLALSVLGFAAAGVIPTQSGSNPLVGWAIVAACFGAAVVFLLRARNREVQARVDSAGVYARRSGETVAWDRIESLTVLRAGIQRIARFRLRDGGRTIGINTSFYDHGLAELLESVRAHRPDLA